MPTPVKPEAPGSSLRAHYKGHLWTFGQSRNFAQIDSTGPSGQVARDNINLVEALGHDRDDLFLEVSDPGFLRRVSTVFGHKEVDAEAIFGLLDQVLPEYDPNNQPLLVKEQLRSLRSRAQMHGTPNAHNDYMAALSNLTWRLLSRITKDAVLGQAVVDAQMAREKAGWQPSNTYRLDAHKDIGRQRVIEAAQAAAGRAIDDSMKKEFEKAFSFDQQVGHFYNSENIFHSFMTGLVNNPDNLELLLDKSDFTFNDLIDDDEDAERLHKEIKATKSGIDNLVEENPDLLQQGFYSLGNSLYYLAIGGVGGAAIKGLAKGGALALKHGGKAIMALMGKKAPKALKMAGVVAEKHPALAKKAVDAMAKAQALTKSSALANTLASSVAVGAAVVPEFYYENRKVHGLEKGLAFSNAFVKGLETVGSEAIFFNTFYQKGGLASIGLLSSAGAGSEVVEEVSHYHTDLAYNIHRPEDVLRMATVAAISGGTQGGGVAGGGVGVNALLESVAPQIRDMANAKELRKKIKADLERRKQVYETLVEQAEEASRAKFHQRAKVEFKLAKNKKKQEQASDIANYKQKKGESDEDFKARFEFESKRKLEELIIKENDLNISIKRLKEAEDALQQNENTIRSQGKQQTETLEKALNAGSYREMRQALGDLALFDETSGPVKSTDQLKDIMRRTSHRLTHISRDFNEKTARFGDVVSIEDGIRRTASELIKKMIGEKPITDFIGASFENKQTGEIFRLLIDHAGKWGQPGDLVMVNKDGGFERITSEHIRRFDELYDFYPHVDRQMLNDLPDQKDVFITDDGLLSFDGVLFSIPEGQDTSNPYVVLTLAGQRKTTRIDDIYVLSNPAAIAMVNKAIQNYRQEKMATAFEEAGSETVDIEAGEVKLSDNAGIATEIREQLLLEFDGSDGQLSDARVEKLLRDWVLMMRDIIAAKRWGPDLAILIQQRIGELINQYPDSGNKLPVSYDRDIAGPFFGFFDALNSYINSAHSKIFISDPANGESLIFFPPHDRQTVVGDEKRSKALVDSGLDNQKLSLINAMESMGQEWPVVFVSYNHKAGSEGQVSAEHTHIITSLQVMDQLGKAMVVIKYPGEQDALLEQLWNEYGVDSAWYVEADVFNPLITDESRFLVLGITGRMPSRMPKPGPHTPIIKSMEQMYEMLSFGEEMAEEDMGSSGITYTSYDGTPTDFRVQIIHDRFMKRGLRHAERALLPYMRDDGTMVDTPREYLRDRLKGADVDILKPHQVDAIFAALHRAENNKSVILADQTGLGKGLVQAAYEWDIILRGEGKGIPVFFTKDATLLNNHADDWKLLGLAGKGVVFVSTNPEISNVAQNLGLTKDEFEFMHLDRATIYDINTRDESNADLLRAEVQNKFGEGRHIVMLGTYSQYQKTSGRLWVGRREFLSGLLEDKLTSIVADEFHEVGGKFETGEDKRAEFFVKETEDHPNPVLLSSATPAKGVGSIRILRRFLDISPEAMEDIVKLHGSGVLELFNTAIAQDGGFIRREKSYDNVSYGFEKADITAEEVNKIATVLTKLTSLSEAVAEHFEDNGEGLGFEGKPKNFLSTMHNLISYLMIGQMVRKTLPSVKKRLMDGNNVIVVFGKTLADAALNNIGPDGYLSNRDLILREYENILTIDGKNYLEEAEANGMDDSTMEIKQIISELFDILGGTGEQGDPFFMQDANYMDIVKNEIRNSGILVSEVSGRSHQMVLKDGKYVREAIKRNTAAEVDRFNNQNNFIEGRPVGNMMALTSAGATGLSLHASERFLNQKERTMFFYELAADTNVLIQTMGRAHRIGTIGNVEMVLATLDIPSEKRRMAMVGEKLKQARAMTDARSGVADIVGDQVIDLDSGAAVMAFREMLGDLTDKDYRMLSTMRFSMPQSVRGKPIDWKAMLRRFTGRLFMVPLESQKSFYDRFATYYALTRVLVAAGGQSVGGQIKPLRGRTETFKTGYFSADTKPNQAISESTELRLVQREFRASSLDGITEGWRFARRRWGSKKSRVAVALEKAANRNLAVAYLNDYTRFFGDTALKLIDSKFVKRGKDLVIYGFAKVVEDKTGADPNVVVRYYNLREKRIEIVDLVPELTKLINGDLEVVGIQEAIDEASTYPAKLLTENIHILFPRPGADDSYFRLLTALEPRRLYQGVFRYGDEGGMRLKEESLVSVTGSDGQKMIGLRMSSRPELDEGDLAKKTIDRSDWGDVVKAEVILYHADGIGPPVEMGAISVLPGETVDVLVISLRFNPIKVNPARFLSSKESEFDFVRLSGGGVGAVYSASQKLPEFSREAYDLGRGIYETIRSLAEAIYEIDPALKIGDFNVHLVKEESSQEFRVDDTIRLLEDPELRYRDWPLFPDEDMKLLEELTESIYNEFHSSFRYNYHRRHSRLEQLISKGFEHKRLRQAADTAGENLEIRLPGIDGKEHTKTLVTEDVIYLSDLLELIGEMTNNRVFWDKFWKFSDNVLGFVNSAPWGSERSLNIVFRAFQRRGEGEFIVLSHTIAHETYHFFQHLIHRYISLNRSRLGKYIEASLDMAYPYPYGDDHKRRVKEGLAETHATWLSYYGDVPRRIRDIHEDGGLSEKAPDLEMLMKMHTKVLRGALSPKLFGQMIELQEILHRYNHMPEQQKAFESRLARDKSVIDKIKRRGVIRYVQAAKENVLTGLFDALRPIEQIYGANYYLSVLLGNSVQVAHSALLWGWGGKIVNDFGVASRGETDKSKRAIITGHSGLIKPTDSFAYYVLEDKTDQLTKEQKRDKDFVKGPFLWVRQNLSKAEQNAFYSILHHRSSVSHELKYAKGEKRARKDVSDGAALRIAEKKLEQRMAQIFVFFGVTDTSKVTKAIEIYDAFMKELIFGLSNLGLIDHRTVRSFMYFDEKRVDKSLKKTLKELENRLKIERQANDENANRTKLEIRKVLIAIDKAALQNRYFPLTRMAPETDKSDLRVVLQGDPDVNPRKRASFTENLLNYVDGESRLLGAVSSLVDAGIRAATFNRAMQMWSVKYKLPYTRNRGFPFFGKTKPIEKKKIESFYTKDLVDHIDPGFIIQSLPPDMLEKAIHKFILSVLHKKSRISKKLKKEIGDKFLSHLRSNTHKHLSKAEDEAARGIEAFLAKSNFQKDLRALIKDQGSAEDFDKKVASWLEAAVGYGGKPVERFFERLEGDLALPKDFGKEIIEIIRNALTDPAVSKSLAYSLMEKVAPLGQAETTHFKTYKVIIPGTHGYETKWVAIRKNSELGDSVDHLMNPQGQPLSLMFANIARSLHTTSIMGHIPVLVQSIEADFFQYGTQSDKLAEDYPWFFPVQFAKMAQTMNQAARGVFLGHREDFVVPMTTLLGPLLRNTEATKIMLFKWFKRSPQEILRGVPQEKRNVVASTLFHFVNFAIAAFNLPKTTEARAIFKEYDEYRKTVEHELTAVASAGANLNNRWGAWKSIALMQSVSSFLKATLAGEYQLHRKLFTDPYVNETGWIKPKRLSQWYFGRHLFSVASILGAFWWFGREVEQAACESSDEECKLFYKNRDDMQASLMTKNLADLQRAHKSLLPISAVNSTYALVGKNEYLTWLGTLANTKLMVEGLKRWGHSAGDSNAWIENTGADIDFWTAFQVQATPPGPFAFLDESYMTSSPAVRLIFDRDSVKDWQRFAYHIGFLSSYTDHLWALDKWHTANGLYRGYIPWLAKDRFFLGGGMLGPSGGYILNPFTRTYIGTSQKGRDLLEEAGRRRDERKAEPGSSQLTLDERLNDALERQARRDVDVFGGIAGEGGVIEVDAIARFRDWARKHAKTTDDVLSIAQLIRSKFKLAEKDVLYANVNPYTGSYAMITRKGSTMAADDPLKKTPLRTIFDFNEAALRVSPGSARIDTSVGSADLPSLADWRQTIETFRDPEQGGYASPEEQEKAPNKVVSEALDRNIGHKEILFLQLSNLMNGYNAELHELFKELEKAEAEQE